MWCMYEFVLMALDKIIPIKFILENSSEIHVSHNSMCIFRTLSYFFVILRYVYVSLKEEDEFNRYVYICVSVGWPGIRTTHGLEQRVKRMAYKNVCWNWLKPRRKKKFLNYRCSIYEYWRVDVYYLLSGVGLTLCISMQ